MIPQTHLDDVNDHISHLGLSDVNFMGNPMTWTNRRSGPALIMERLDRAMENGDWFAYFPNAIVYHLTSIGSDHLPILLVSSRDQNPTKKPNRFSKCWLIG